MLFLSGCGGGCDLQRGPGGVPQLHSDVPPAQDSGLLHTAASEKVTQNSIDCSNILSLTRIFTLSFRSFSPMPNTLEFQPGQDYYFISTSSPEDVMSLSGGFCSSHNMKVMFKVLASSADSKADEGAALESKDQSSSVREAEGGGGRTERPAASLLVTTLCLTYFTH